MLRIREGVFGAPDMLLQAVNRWLLLKKDLNRCGLMVAVSISAGLVIKSLRFSKATKFAESVIVHLAFNNIFCTIRGKLCLYLKRITKR